MSDDQKLVAGGIAVVVLLVLWFGWMAVRAVRNRRPHGKSVTRAAQKVLDADSGGRPDKVDLTEHVAWFSTCEPPMPEVAGAVGKRGYLALTKTHLVFVPYHRADIVVFDRSRLGEPGSKHKKVWKKARGSFSLTYQPAAAPVSGGSSDSARPGPDVRVSFKVRQPYTWLFKFGYRSGLADDPFS